MTIRQTGAAEVSRKLGPDLPVRQVRAHFCEQTVRVYQAFSLEIASKATRAKTFAPPFKRARMTWIKPSFSWMMYRSGWGTKPGQERILGVDVLRSGFEWALAHSSVAHFDATLHSSCEEWRAMLQSSCVRIQWDPERDLHLKALPWRTIQVGFGGEAVDAYLDEWITNIEDVTTLAMEVEIAVKQGDRVRAQHLVPVELPYPLPNEIARRIDCTVESLG